MIGLVTENKKPLTPSVLVMVEETASSSYRTNFQTKTLF